MLNRSCLGQNTMGRSSNPMQLLSNFKSPKGVEDGELDVKSLCNISEENLTQEQGEHYLLVFVLNKYGKPLMPCKPQRAKRLLKEGKATVVNLTPFTIQLLYGSSGYKQKVILGIDAGYSKVGFSAKTDKKELIGGEIELRSDIKRLLEKRSAYRKTRRGRLWHREPRFLNRTSKKKKGWFAPSIQHKLDSHIKLVKKINDILPISQTIVEVASFDTQKMQNPEIKGVEYQQGELYGGYEVREYLLEKWGRKCAYCGKTNLPLEVEHIIPKSRGGSDRVSNLTISCHDCNQRKGNKTAEEFGYPDIQEKAKKSLKAAAFMNTVRQKLVGILGCDYTFGYITKHNRIKLGLEKSHANDAFVIAGGTNQKRSVEYKGKQVRRQNRSLFKANLLKGGRRKRNTLREVKGFKRFDKVLYKSKKCFIYGLRKSGYFDVRTINGEKVSDSAKSKELTLLEKAKGIILEVKGQFLPSLTEGVSLPI